MKTKAMRYHDISCGHRVVGHENKCRYLHGHNYRIHFHCQAEQLDGIGRVIDFSVIKEKLCLWLEGNWDHKFLVWEKDPMFDRDYVIVTNTDSSAKSFELLDMFWESFVRLPFNPTAENMASYLIDVVGPEQLEGTGVTLTQVIIEETAKCHASVWL